jgi:hypothetical protein
VGPETPMSPCSKSTTCRLIQVPCLHRGHHARFPPFLYPSPSIFSIFPPLFPPCSIIAIPSLLPHRASPPAALVRSPLSFPFPFLFSFFFLVCPRSASHPCCPPPFTALLRSASISSVLLFFFFFFRSRPADHPRRRSLCPTLLRTHTTLDIHRKCRTKEMQCRKDRQS